MPEVVPSTILSDAGGGWVARLTHHTDGAQVSYTILGRRFDTRQEAELTAQCWWSTGYGRRGVVAAHVRESLGREVRDEDWLPVSAGAKEACALLGSHRPRTEPPGTLHLIAARSTGPARFSNLSPIGYLGHL